MNSIAKSCATGVVVVGRNEGARLERCLDALISTELPVVYVDSGSSDNSVAAARARGSEVVELDRSSPFTAARARNAGFARLEALVPGLEFVQFIDGDCVLQPGWLGSAQAALCAEPGLAAVCGRRREVHPDATPYNRLCDLEWDTEPGRDTDCGGDALVRAAAFREVGGFDPRLPAGEDPELCMRLRAAGWGILRIEAEMTLHDAALLQFGQWWDRTVRTGYTSAQWWHVRATPLGRVRLRRTLSALAWALGLPIALSYLAVYAHAGGHAGVWVYPAALLVWPCLALVSFVRARASRVRRGVTGSDASLYGRYCLLAKFPESQGVLKFALHRLLGRRVALIEYKGATTAPLDADRARGLS